MASLCLLVTSASCSPDAGSGCSWPVLVVGFACVELGRWQFHRYDERHVSNETIRANQQATRSRSTT